MVFLSSTHCLRPIAALQAYWKLCLLGVSDATLSVSGLDESLKKESLLAKSAWFRVISWLPTSLARPKLCCWAKLLVKSCSFFIFNWKPRFLSLSRLIVRCLCIKALFKDSIRVFWVVIGSATLALFIPQFFAVSRLCAQRYGHKHIFLFTSEGGMVKQHLTVSLFLNSFESDPRSSRSPEKASLRPSWGVRWKRQTGILDSSVLIIAPKLFHVQISQQTVSGAADNYENKGRNL